MPQGPFPYIPHLSKAFSPTIQWPKPKPAWPRPSSLPVTLKHNYSGEDHGLTNNRQLMPCDPTSLLQFDLDSSCQFLKTFIGEGHNFVAPAESDLQYHPSAHGGPPLCGDDQEHLLDHQEQAHAHGGGQDGHLVLGEAVDKAKNVNPSKSWRSER